MHKNAPSVKAWRSLRKNWIAMVSLGYIVCNILVACFAYWIIPDSTPNADRQLLEAALVAPGTSVQVIRMRSEQQEFHTGPLAKTMHGAYPPYTLIPVETVEEKGAFLAYRLYGNPVSVEDSISRDLLYDQQSQVKPVMVHFLLGSDGFGRDVFSRLILGSRISLFVGFIAVAISLLIGVVLGATAGYYKGKTDAVISWLINVTWSIPTVLLVLAISLALGKGLLPVFVAVGLTMWVDVARVVRGQFLSLREKEFAEAAHALGYQTPRIIFRHLLPNAVGPLMVVAVSNFAAAILIEAGLSFLGLGAPPPVPSWGNMIESHRQYLVTGQAWLAIAPGLAIMLLVLAFTMLGAGIQKAISKDA